MQITSQEDSAKQAEARSSKELLIVALCLILTMIGPFAADSYLPSMPAMTKFFHTTDSMMKLTITFYLLGFSLSQLIYGPISDQIGRRKTVLIGMGIALLGSTLCIFAPTPLLLISERFIQGAGIGVTSSIFRAMMRDTFHGVRLAKISSYSSMIFAIVPALAPIIGGYLQAKYNWHANFIFLALLITIVWFIMWWKLPETNRQLNPDAMRIKVILANYKKLLTSKVFVGYALCSSLAFSGVIAYCAISPFLMQNILGLSPVAYGWLNALLAASLLLGNFINSLIVSTAPPQRLVFLGISLMLGSGILMWILGYLGILNVPAVIFPAFLFIAGGGFIYANAFAGAFDSFANMAGAAGAMYGCLQVLGTFTTSLFAAGVSSKTQMPLATIYIALAVIAMTTFYGLVRQKA